MKKILAVLLASMLLFNLVGCGNDAGSQTQTGEVSTEEAGAEASTETGQTSETTAGIELSADGRYPAETVKIGFVNFDTTADQVLLIQSYFEYLQQYLNFEIVWSESLKNAEQEFAFIEQCAAAGCQGIIGYYNEGLEESQKLASSLGMYYWGYGGLPETYELVKNDPMYVGGVTVGDNADYMNGKALVDMLVANDAHKVIVMSGGKQYGVEMFVNRYNGIMDGIKEAQEAGKDIEVVYEVPGWPGTEEFAAHQTAALEMDADSLAGTLTGMMWIQPLQNAGKFGQIKFACIDTIFEGTVDMMDAGLYVGVSAEPTGMFGTAIPLIINAVTGYNDNQRHEDGTAALVTSKSLNVYNVEDMKFYANLVQGDGEWIWDIEDIKSVLGGYNPEFTLEDMNTLYSAVSVEQILARKND